jgi:hypothetical protein
MGVPTPKQADPLGDNVQLDEAVLAKLPPNSKVLSVGSGGPSLWVKTVKIVVQLEDGSTTEFFKKVRRTSDFLIFPTEGLRAQC